MKKHITHFTNQLLVRYLPLLAIFATGAATILFAKYGSILFNGGLVPALSELIAISTYFVLLHLYSRSVGKDIKHMFLATLVGSIIIAAGFLGGDPKTIIGGIVVAFIYIGFLGHKKWV